MVLSVSSARSASVFVGASIGHVEHTLRRLLRSGGRFPRLPLSTACCPKDFVCPEAHLETARAFVKNCGHFLVIGFSGRDEHILDFLQGVRSNSCWWIVSRGDARAIYERFRCRVGSLKSGNAKVYFNDMGFSAFVERAAFEQFLADQ